MTFYAEMADTALQLLAEFGQTVTLLRESTDYTPYASATQGETWTGTAAVFDSGLKSGQTYADGSLVRAGDKKILLAAKGLPVMPQTGDKVVFGGAEYTVLQVLQTNPAGAAVVYTLMGRR